MKLVCIYALVLTTGAVLSGCSSSETPQASQQLKSQFAGSPMPPDARQKFEESMKKNRELTDQRAKSGGKQ